MTGRRRAARKAGLALLLTVSLMMLAIPALAEKPEITIGIHVDEGPLTPYGYTFGNPGLQMVRVIYDTLFILDASRQPQPWMVEEYSISEDGRTWTMKLYPDITFHDGEPLTARDVEFTYNYMEGPSHSGWQRAVGSVSSVEVLDDLTLAFHLEEPNPLLIQVALAVVPIIPQHIWENVGFEDARAFEDATGSGPYNLVEYRSGQYYRLESHPDYFHPDWEPTLKTIIMPIIPDQTTLFASLRSGEVDMSTREIPPELVGDMDRPGEIELLQGPTYVSTLLLINCERPPFDQVEFRRALSLAVDAEYLMETLRLGYGTVGSPGFVHPQSPWVRGSVGQRVYDPQAAGDILDGLGFVDVTGNGFRENPQGEAFAQTILVYAERPERVRAAEIMAEWLEEVGLKTEVKAMEAGTVDSLVWPEFDVTKGRDFDLAIWGWSAGIQENPLSLRAVFHSAGTLNVGAFSHDRMDSVSDRLLTSQTLEDVPPAIGEMAEIVAQQVPFVTLWYPDSVYGFRPEAYAGWTFVTGVGVLDQLSLIGPRVEGDTGEPDQAAPVDEGPEPGLPSWVWPLVIVALAGIYLLVRRR